MYWQSQYQYHPRLVGLVIILHIGVLDVGIIQIVKHHIVPGVEERR